MDALLATPTKAVSVYRMMHTYKVAGRPATHLEAIWKFLPSAMENWSDLDRETFHLGCHYIELVTTPESALEFLRPFDEMDQWDDDLDE